MCTFHFHKIPRIECTGYSLSVCSCICSWQDQLTCNEFMCTGTDRKTITAKRILVGKPDMTTLEIGNNIKMYLKNMKLEIMECII